MSQEQVEFWPNFGRLQTPIHEYRLIRERNRTVVSVDTPKEFVFLDTVLLAVISSQNLIGHALLSRLWLEFGQQGSALRKHVEVRELLALNSDTNH